MNEWESAFWEIVNRAKEEAKMSEAKTTPAVVTGVSILESTVGGYSVYMHFDMGKNMLCNSCLYKEKWRAERHAAELRREYGLEPRHKACPFCGSHDAVACQSWIKFHVLCNGCRTATGFGNTEAEAWAAWDKRAE